ncbi:MAG: cyclic nucleotide-binding domain-containing protein [Kofleriaceae bacterium]
MSDSEVPELERRLRDEPDNLGLRVTLADAMCQAGRIDEAIALYRSIALAYRDQGRTQLAIDVCRRLLAAAPNDRRGARLLEMLLAEHAARSTRDTAQIVIDDLSAELDRLARAAGPPTVPIEPIEPIEFEDEPTPPPTDGVPYGEAVDEDTAPRELPIGTVQTHSVLRSAFFAPLPDDQRASVLAKFVRSPFAAGSVVIREGEVGHPLVIVVRGRLDIRVQRHGKQIQLGTVTIGEYVGEGALLAHGPAPASVIAATDADVLLVQPKIIYELAVTYPALWAELRDVSEQRAREHALRLQQL